MQFFDLYKFIISREISNHPSERLQISYKPVSSMNVKTMHSMINFLWVKIEEKFTKPSQAFRYFDDKSRSKISYSQFENAITKLKIKFHKDNIREIFTFLDQDKDKFLNYMEFSRLNQNSNFTSRIPADDNDSKTRLSTRARSNDVSQRLDQSGKILLTHYP